MIQWRDERIIETHARRMLDMLGNPERDVQRVHFEADAAPMGFDLTRSRAGQISAEPWAEYADDATGHRWGGWLAARGIA